LFAAVAAAGDAVATAENAADGKKKELALSYAEYKFEEGKKLFGVKGSASSESPPHSPSRCW
jgi:hypothetical protein